MLIVNPHLSTDNNLENGEGLHATLQFIFRSPALKIPVNFTLTIKAVMACTTAIDF